MKIGRRNLSYWMKGGIIGIIFSILIILIDVISVLLYYDNRPKFLGIIFIFGFALSFFDRIISYPFLGSYLLAIILPFIILILFYFVIDVIVGYVVGKIKNR